MEKYKTYPLTENDHDRRLDRVVRVLLPHLTLSEIQRALRKGDIRLDGKKAAPDCRTQSGQTLEVYQPLTLGMIKKAPSKVYLPVEKWLLHQDGNLAVFNKPKGILAHGPDSLDTSVKAFLAPLLPPSLSFRPGLLHRLDQTSSGIIVFSTSLHGAREFTRLMQTGGLRKDYLALLHGELKKDLDLENRLDRDEQTLVSRESPTGKRARTTIRPVFSRKGYTLALCRIETGLTHQIRLQASLAGYPLWGDLKYGGPRGDLFLHAWRLGFIPPWEGLEELEAPFDPDILNRTLGEGWEAQVPKARQWSKIG